MKAFVLSQSTARTPEKLIEANELLFIAAETYEKSAQARDSVGPLAVAADTQDASTTHNLAVNDSDCDDRTDDSTRASDARIAQSMQHMRATAQRPHAPPPPPQRVQTQLKESSVIAAAPVAATSGSDDVQRRLGSLLARMQRRQAQANE